MGDGCAHPHQEQRCQAGCDRMEGATCVCWSVCCVCVMETKDGIQRGQGERERGMRVRYDYTNMCKQHVPACSHVLASMRCDMRHAAATCIRSGCECEWRMDVLIRIRAVKRGASRERHAQSDAGCTLKGCVCDRERERDRDGVSTTTHTCVHNMSQLAHMCSRA